MTGERSPITSSAAEHGPYLLLSMVVWYMVQRVFVSYTRTLSIYTRLEPKAAILWPQKMANMLHAMVMVLAPMSMQYFHHQDGGDGTWTALRSDLIYAQHWFVPVLGYITMGYMVVDLCLEQSSGSQYWMFVAHHTMVIVGTVAVLATGMGHGVCLVAARMELSTMFVHMRWFLRAVGGFETGHGWRHGVFIVNGAALVVSFLVTRVAAWPGMLLDIASSRRISVWQLMATVMRPYCVVSFVLLLALNTWWFLLILRATARVILPRTSTSNQHQKQR